MTVFSALIFGDDDTKETLLPQQSTNFGLTIDTSDVSSIEGVGSFGNSCGASSSSPLLSPSREGTPKETDIDLDLFEWQINIDG